MKFAAQGTQQAGEEQGTEHRATEPEEQGKVPTPTVESTPGLEPPLATCLLAWSKCVSEVFSPKSVPENWGRGGLETIQSKP